MDALTRYPRGVCNEIMSISEQVLKGATREARHGATRAQDGVTVGIGAWLIGALFSDGWAHHNVPELEGFFTPWHGALYSGLALAAAWFVWLGRTGGARWYLHLPAGYGAGAAGLAVFTTGGMLDMTWHLVFGVEAGIDALLSPSHLVLFSGGLLILSSAIRSRWGQADTSSAVAMGALTLATALVAFFLLYVSEFVAAAPTEAFTPLPEGHPDHTESELPATSGVGAFLITTALIATPLLLTWQRGPVPKGLLTLLVGTTSWLSAGIVDLERSATVGAAGATLGALLAEPVLAKLDRRGMPPARRMVALAVTAILPVWVMHMFWLAIGVGLAWPIELWSGTVVISVLAAAALAALASRPHTPQAQAARS